MVRKKAALVSLLVLLACASGLKQQINEYRNSLENKDFPQAASQLEKSKLKEDGKVKLLWSLEKGSMSLLLKDYDQAIFHFENAVALIDELYTKKISAKITSFLINDAQDVFYGSGHERSYTYYYLSRSYFERYTALGDKKDLFSARAAILAWDSYFAQVQRSGVKTLYRSDLLMKIFGAQIHEQVQRKSDAQIALQLYKDAWELSKVLGGIYQYFNTESSEFIKASELALLEENKTETKHFSPTQGHEDFLNFLRYKILSLTFLYRPYDFKNQLKSLKASQEIAERAQKIANLNIIIEEGLISRKVGNKFSFGLKGVINNVDDPKARQVIARQGAPVIAAFAMNTLGMRPKSSGAGSFLFAHQVTTLAVSEAAIEFELPMIEKTVPAKRWGLYILDANKKVIEVRPLVLMSQTSDLARLVLEENIVSQYALTGSRIAGKHVLAIVAAYTLYQQLKTPENDLIARTLALGSYVAAAKGISWMEEADTRQWVSLPASIRLQEFSLKAGRYQLAIGFYSASGQWEESPSKILGEVEVSDIKQLFTFRL